MTYIWNHKREWNKHAFPKSKKSQVNKKDSEKVWQLSVKHLRLISWPPANSLQAWKHSYEKINPY